MPRNRSQASLAAPAQRAGDLRRKRSLAKTGMTASLGILAATGIMEGLGKRSRTVRSLHVLSGLSLMGFSLWHYSLYGTGPRSA